MSANVVNQVAFLRTSREFPEEPKQFSVEVTKAYIDTANAVNNRTISIFPTTRPAINGESWFLTGNQKQQGSRQVYVIPAEMGVLPSTNHGIRDVTPSQFIRCFGSYTDTSTSNTNGLIFGSDSATTIPGQISFFISPTQIVFKTDAAAPTPVQAIIVVEWISQK